MTLRRRTSTEATGLINEFLGSSHVFHSVVTDVIENGLLRDVTHGKLTFPQLKLLRIVALEIVQSVSEVAAFLGVSKAAASKAVDGLVRRRLLKRSEGKPDRRSIHVSLTAQGQRLMTEYHAARDARLGALFSQFTANELSHTAKLLDRLSTRMSEDREEAHEVCHQCSIYFRERCHMRQMVNRNCLYSRHRSKRRER
ncbi:MAG: winged helix DNA-binding protein [Gemmatimonadaceae bacterium]|nr:winged helix DNA-binding protein [Gemmatimonadaceae bacterium]